MRYWLYAAMLLAVCGMALAETPAEMPGLMLWMRADVGVTKDAEGRVSAVKDQSGKGNDFLQADPALQPLLVTSDNHQPALRFDGVDDALSLATAIPVTGKSVFAVVKWNKVKGYSFPLGLDAGTDGYLRMSNATQLLVGGRYPMLYQNSLPNPKVGYTPGDGRFIFHKNLRNLLQWNVFAVTDNPQPNEKLKHLGKNELNNVPENRFDGEIAELLVYDRALTSAERLKVEEYLEGKYLGWPGMRSIPITGLRFETGLYDYDISLARAVKSTEVPLESLGSVMQQGISERSLEPGCYLLSFRVKQSTASQLPIVLIGQTTYRAESVAYRTAPEVAVPEGYYKVSFVQTEKTPVLVRLAWEKIPSGTIPHNASATELHLYRLSPLFIKSVQSDKIFYSPNQNAVATATIHNFAAKAMKADVRFTEITGLNDCRFLGTQTVEVPADGEVTVTLPYNVGVVEYGRNLLAEIVRDGEVVEGKYNSYNVADNLWKVAIGARQIAQTGATTAETYAKEMLRVRAGYGNWVEKDFWAPDDWGLMVTPPGATWFSGQARRHENTERLRQQVDAAHAHGIKAITYGKCMAGGLPGWELARKKPQWFSVDAYGRTIGRPADVWDMEHWQEADKYKYSDYKYAWTYRWVDLRQMAPLEHGIDQLIASAKQFGWDGVRYDSGGFRAHFVPKDGKVLFDGVDSYNARNMRYTKERVWKELPGFLFGVNTNDPYSVGGVSPLKPTDKCGHEFREMLAGDGLWMFEGMRDKPNFWGRRTYKTWSDYASDMVQAIRTIKGYGGHVCFSYGDTELYKFMIGTMIGAHDYMGEHLQAKGSENWGQFLTRWSSFIWDHRLRALPDEGMVTVTSPHPVWWKGFSNELVVSPTKRYVIIHLMNPPVNDECAKTKDEVPEPMDGISVVLAHGTEKLLRAYFIAPGTPNCTEMLLSRSDKAGISHFVLPILDVWGMVVVELEGQYTVPKDPPAFTEPLSKDELAEIEQCKPTFNVPVADNMQNPTPRFDPELAKPRDFGTAKVTPPAGLTVGGEPGTDILLVKGFYYYTYRLPEALKALAPDARVTECSSRDLPKDYADLYKYDVVGLINMGAEYWNADGHKRLADYVQAGGRLVVFGGQFTLGLGFFKGTALEAVLPVEVRQARDVYQAPKPLVLNDGKKSLSGNPLLYYFHAVTPKPGAKVLLKAGDLPVLYEWTFGKGTVRVFTGTTMGEPQAKGETPFWEWNGWHGMAMTMLLN